MNKLKQVVPDSRKGNNTQRMDDGRQAAHGHPAHGNPAHGNPVHGNPAHGHHSHGHRSDSAHRPQSGNLMNQFMQAANPR